VFNDVQIDRPEAVAQAFEADSSLRL